LLPILLISLSLLSNILLAVVSSIRNNFVYPISVYGKITIDAYGVVLPVVISVLFIIAYFSYLKGSFLRFLGCFLFALTLSALSFQPVGGYYGFELQSLAGNLAFLISFVSVFVIFFDWQAFKSKTVLSYIRSGIAKKSFAVLFAAFSVSSLSALSIDLIWAPFLNQIPSWNTVNIGGGGLTDGVLVSGLFALVWTTFFVSLLALIVEIMYKPPRKYKGSKKQVIKRRRKRSARKAN
jgi:hypothetical protein